MIIKTTEQFENEIKNNRISGIYILLGEDVSRKIEFINQIRQRGNFEYISHDSVNLDINLLLNDISTSGLFTSSKIIVLKNFEKIKKEPYKIFSEHLNSINLSNTLIFIFYNENLRDYQIKNTFEKFASNNITLVKIENLTESEIREYIISRIKENNREIEEEAVNFLASNIYEDYGILKNEVEKLILYSKLKREKISLSDVIDLLGIRKEENAFELINSILSGNFKKIINTINKLIEKKEEPLFILNTIYIALDKLLKIIYLKKSIYVNDYSTLSALNIYRSDLQRIILNPEINEKKIETLIEYCLDTENTLKTNHTYDAYLLIKNLIFMITDYLKISSNLQRV